MVCCHVAKWRGCWLRPTEVGDGFSVERCEKEPNKNVLERELLREIADERGGIFSRLNPFGITGYL
jgi:hypothetical protein